MTKQDKNTNAGAFGRIGIVLAAAGSAVGLGNIWKFPYMMGDNGGAAFLLVYLGCVLLFGIPLMTAEFYVGKHGLQRWRWFRAITMISATLFFAFYLVITGWCIEYLFESIIGATAGLSPEELAVSFESFTGSHMRPILWLATGLALTAVIEVAGVKGGIERTSKILMPLLLVMLIVMIVRGLTLPGSSEGLRFIFHPDFSKLTPALVLNAMGQCFFSLSIGQGSMASYAAHMRDDQDLTRTSARVITLDTLVAVLAGMAIFPAVFALGINPTEGPELVFVTLPTVFDQMPAGHWLQVLFFLLLTIAALTSTISLMEVELNFLDNTLHMSRRKGVLLSSVCVLALGVLAVMSKTVFGLLDQLVSLYLLPCGGMLFALYVGWRCPKETVINCLTPRGGSRWIGVMIHSLIRYVIPPIIVLIFLHGLGAFGGVNG